MMEILDFKIIYRQLFRNRTYTFINLIGLIFALKAVLLISNHVLKEGSMDRFHQNANRIYRVTEKNNRQNNTHTYSDGPLAPAAQKELPGIQAYTRYLAMNDHTLKTEEQREFSAQYKTVCTDRSFFDIFSFPILRGALSDDPAGVVISQKVADTYFGKQNPIGQTLYLRNARERQGAGAAFTVQAVMADMPRTSSIQADVVLNYSHLPADYSSWNTGGGYTFLLLEQQADVAQTEQGIARILEKHRPWQKPADHEIHLQPLKDIYFKSEHMDADGLLRGSLRMTSILGGVTLLILLLAACNYFMIRLACLNRCMTEYAVQRCYGAKSKYIRRQLYLEIILQMIVALGVAFLLAWWLHPYFIKIVSPRQLYPFQLSWQGAGMLSVIMTGFVVALSSGLYFYLDRRLTHHSIKEALTPLSSSRTWNLRSVLTLTQLAIFVALMFCSVVLIRQIEYIKNKSLGYEHKNRLSLWWPKGEQDAESLKAEILKNPWIKNVSNGTFLPFNYNPEEKIYLENQEARQIGATFIAGDADFPDTYRIKLSSGRKIDKNSYSPRIEERGRMIPGKYDEVLVNRQFVEALGLEHPVGAVFYRENITAYRIVGVIEDVYFKPLYEKMTPLVITANMPSPHYIINYDPAHYTEVTQFLEQLFDRYFPGLVCSIHTYVYANWYTKDIALAKMIIAFTAMAILISGMGIFAFSVFMAESKRKEVVIRKVNGAAEGEIIRLLNSGFIKKILLACLVGLPFAWYAMQKWLEAFVYKTPLTMWVVLLAAGICLLTVIAVTSRQLWKAAITNPVDVIKNE